MISQGKEIQDRDRKEVRSWGELKGENSLTYNFARKPNKIINSSTVSLLEVMSKTMSFICLVFE